MKWITQLEIIKITIGFGKCSKNYRYILGTVVCKILKNFIFNNELDPKDEEGFFDDSDIEAKTKFDLQIESKKKSYL